MFPRSLRWLALALPLAFSWPVDGQPAPATVPGAIKIAVVSDTHTTRDTGEDRVLYRGHFDQVIAAVNAAHVRFVLMTGDLTQFSKPSEFAEFKAQAKGFSAPVFWVPGNHDDGNKRLPPRDPGPTEEQLERCERELGPTFYARDESGVHIIAVNSQLLGSGLARENDQWTFLEQQLAQPVREPTLVFMHMPPFLNAADEPAGIYWSLDPAPRQRFLELLARGHVHTVITGHLHRPLINTHAGILFVSCPAVSFGAPRGVTPPGWTLLTVQRDGDVQVDFKPLPDDTNEAAARLAKVKAQAAKAANAMR